MATNRNGEFHSWIKIGGLVFLLPITLITWPLVGYFIGRYLEQHSPLVLFISIVAGLTVTFKTTARILRMILKIYRDIGKKQIAKKFSES
jgi:hypothetical protein